MNAISIVAATVAGAVDTRVFHVLLANMSRVEIALQSLAKRAARKGLPVLTWSWGKAYSERTQVPHAEYGWQVPAFADVSFVPLTLPSAAPKYAGWTFVAALQHLDGENIVRAVPGETVPDAFRSRGPMCDHCRQLRRRNDTYVLRHEDGRTVQVGSTCIGDFLGSDDAGRLAAQASMFAEARSLAEGGGEGSGAASSDRLMGDFLAFVSFCVRSHGWKSRTVAREQGGQATADSAWGFLVDAKLCAKYDVEPTAEDKEAAQAAEVWAESLSDATINAEKSDYLHNVRAVARTGLVNYRTAGIAGSIIVAHQRAIGRERERAAKAALPSLDAYVGTVGKRETFSATLEHVTGYDTQYGYTTVLKFRTAEGALLVWKASSTDIERSDVGKAYKVTGSVKSHEEYKGAKQTILTRCKVVTA
jgi:hypothetical protein